MSKKRKLAIDMMYHYTYRITNIKEGKYYYGVHSCDCLPKEDIGIKYWSSTKRDGFVEHQKQNPEQYKYKVLKIFSTRVEAVEHEIFLHKKFNVKLHEKFYNDANQRSTNFDTTGKGNYIDENGNIVFISVFDAKERNLKGSNTGKSSQLKGKKLTSEHILKLSKSHKGQNLGIPKTDEIKRKISNSNKGKKRTDDTRKNISESQKGKIIPIETREKISNALTGRILTEDHCNNISNGKKGKKYSEEACRNMSIGQKGKHVWNKGVTNMQSHSEETKNVLSAHFAKTKWINDNVVGKRVLETEVEQYLENGWQLGRCRKGISNG